MKVALVSGLWTLGTLALLGQSWAGDSKGIPAPAVESKASVETVASTSSSVRSQAWVEVTDPLVMNRAKRLEYLAEAFSGCEGDGVAPDTAPKINLLPFSLEGAMAGLIDNYNHPPDWIKVTKAWQSPYLVADPKNPDPYRGLVLLVEDTRKGDNKSFEGNRFAIQIEFSDSKDPTKKTLEWHYFQTTSRETVGNYSFAAQECVKMLGVGATPPSLEVTKFLGQMCGTGPIKEIISSHDFIEAVYQFTGSDRFYPLPSLGIHRGYGYVPYTFWLSTDHPVPNNAYVLDGLWTFISSSDVHSSCGVLATVPTRWFADPKSDSQDSEK